MSSQYGCVVVCVNVLACGQPKCKQCWTTGQSDFLVRDWSMMLMMSSTSGGSENANLDCFWWRSSQVSILMHMRKKLSIPLSQGRWFAQRCRALKGVDLQADTVTFIPCLLKPQDYSTTSQSLEVSSGALNPLKFVFSYCHSWFTFKEGKYDH